MLARIWLVAVRASDLLATFELQTYIGYLTNTPGPLVWFALARSAIAIAAARLRASAMTIAAGAVAVAVLTHSAAFCHEAGE